MQCPDCLKVFRDGLREVDYIHSCFRACRVCGTAIDPSEGYYCWFHKPEEEQCPAT